MSPGGVCNTAMTGASPLTNTFSSDGEGRAAWGAWERASAFSRRVPFRCRTLKVKLARISNQQRIIPVEGFKGADQRECSIVSVQDEGPV